jgi:hypothetical protein
VGRTPKEVATAMKKLFALLFAFALAASLVMPAFADEAAGKGQEPAPKTTTKEKKTKTKKAAKTEQKTEKTEEKK